jgi:pimeloyl-ACP methyl ester carboxylesterase
MEVLEFGNYRAHFVAADADRLVISMASRGRVAGESQFEWGSTFNRLGLKSNFLYVKDISNSWYADPDGWDDLCEFVLTIIRERNIKWTVAFGLSMGGYGALLLASRLPLNRVIGFGPQTCIGAEAPFDQRFQADWNMIKDPTFTNAIDLNYGNCEIVLIACSEDLTDVQHISFFPDNDPLIHKFMLLDSHHFRHMHTIGALDDVLNHLLGGEDANETPHVLRPKKAIYQFANEFMSGNSDLAFRNYFGRSDREDRLFPNSLYPTLFEHLAKEGVSTYPARHQQDLLVTYPDQYMHKGWSVLEKWGRWSHGDEATIRFNLVDACMPNKNFLIIGFLLLPDFVNTQRVTFRGGLSKPQHFEILSIDMTVHTVFLPVASGECEIVIQTPDAATPRQRSGTSDDRRLGIGVTKLMLG